MNKFCKISGKYIFFIKREKMKKFISLVLVLFLANAVCFAKVKNYKAEATEDIPSNKAQDEVVSSLLQTLTKQAIEQSGIKLKDYNLSDSEYNQFVKDVTKVEVKNKKVFMKKDNLQAVNIKLNVAMDADIAKAYLYQVKETRKAKNVAEVDPIKKDKPQQIIPTPDGTVIIAKKTPAPAPKIAPILDSTPTKAEAAEKAKAENKIKTEISTITAKVEAPATPVSNNVTVAPVVTEKPAPKERISINQALQEAQSTKKEVKTLLDDFNNSLKESNNEIIKSYDSKISKINTNIKKDQWETTKQYNSRVTQNKQEKIALENEKGKAITENKIKIAQMVVPTIQPKIEQLKSYQTDKFYDENSVKAKIVSLGEVNADEKYFEIKTLYDNEQSIISNLKYDFSDMSIEQAKEIYKTPNKFIIEPLFSIEENEETGELRKVLTAFGIKHADIAEEKVVNLAKKIKPFKEITKFEAYEKMLNK